MKTFFKKSLFLLFAGVLFIGCKGKDGDPGPQGATGSQGESGPSAKKYSYSLTFGPTLNTRQSYLGIPTIGANDIILTYVHYDGAGNGSIYTLANFSLGTVTMISTNDVFGDVYVDLIKTDLSPGSPLASNSTYNFYSVVIKGESGLRRAGIDYGNYEEVKAYYNLQD